MYRFDDKKLQGKWFMRWGFWPLTRSSKGKVTLTESARAVGHATRVLRCPSAPLKIVRHVGTTWVVIIDAQVDEGSPRSECCATKCSLKVPNCPSHYVFPYSQCKHQIMEITQKTIYVIFKLLDCND